MTEKKKGRSARTRCDGADCPPAVSQLSRLVNSFEMQRFLGPARSMGKMLTARDEVDGAKFASVRLGSGVDLLMPMHNNVRWKRT